MPLAGAASNEAYANGESRTQTGKRNLVCSVQSADA